jgi:hypothetical protein
MAISPERNDVDISKLFNWGKKFEIFDRFGHKITDAYIRLIGDAEINRSRVFAIRKSSELRKSLKTEGTDERVAFISSVYEIEEQELIDVVVNLSIRRFAQEAAKEIKVPFPKEPRSDAALEKFEAYQAELDGYEEKRNAELTRVTLEKAEAYKITLQSTPITEIKKTYEKLMIDTLCEQEMMKVYRQCCGFYGTFVDEEYKIRMFTEYDDFDNLPTEVKTQYLDNYDSLEINVDFLKKLQEATQ